MRGSSNIQSLDTSLDSDIWLRIRMEANKRLRWKFNFEFDPIPFHYLSLSRKITKLDNLKTDISNQLLSENLMQQRHYLIG